MSGDFQAFSVILDCMYKCSNSIYYNKDAINKIAFDSIHSDILEFDSLKKEN